jgi:hypothetical protein
MTRYELIDSVPVHDYEGRLFYVDLSEIPLPWRDQFWVDLYFFQMPVIAGVRRAAFAWDFQSWACSDAPGGPVGLDCQ